MSTKKREEKENKGETVYKKDKMYQTISCRIVKNKVKRFLER